MNKWRKKSNLDKHKTRASRPDEHAQLLWLFCASCQRLCATLDRWWWADRGVVVAFCWHSLWLIIIFATFFWNWIPRCWVKYLLRSWQAIRVRSSPSVDCLVSASSFEAWCTSRETRRRIDRRRPRRQSRTRTTWRSSSCARDTDSSRRSWLVCVATWSGSSTWREATCPRGTTTWTCWSWPRWRWLAIRRSAEHLASLLFLIFCLIVCILFFTASWLTWSCLTSSTVKLNQILKRELHVSGRMNKSYSKSEM